MDYHLWISGVHSDTDPSPGIGIARSIRAAFPDARLTGIDYSAGSTGIHDPVFDDVWVQPSWADVDVGAYEEQIETALLAVDGRWISGLDVEVAWLAPLASKFEKVLSPSATVERAIRKPEIEAAGILGMHVPVFLPSDAAPADIHALGRGAGWRLWIKGRYHDALPAHSVPEVYRRLDELETQWLREDLFIQEHIHGVERAYAFAAYRGELLAAVEVEKRLLTPRGKTWGAAVRPLADGPLERLRDLVSRAKWTGGGEVEFLRAEGGRDYVIDVNPRFPAYVFGVTLCGWNLPAMLVAASYGSAFASAPTEVEQFVRVVYEIPVRAGFPLRPRSPGDLGTLRASKHPSDQPSLVRSMVRSPRRTDRPGPTDRPETCECRGAPTDLPARFPAAHLVQTPSRIRTESAIQPVLEHLAAAIANASGRPAIIPALSVKTDPWPPLGRAFAARGWSAEVISREEFAWARGVGFFADRIILSGPMAVDPRPERAGIVFADSVGALTRAIQEPPAEIVGVRIATTASASRFGIDLCDARTFRATTASLALLPASTAWAAHMHAASDVIGSRAWWDLFQHFLRWTKSLTEVTRRSPLALDLGGGWHPDDFPALLARLRDIQDRILTALPEVEAVYLEPGKAISSQTASLVTRIVGVRSNATGRGHDVVVDTSIADLPLASRSPLVMTHIRSGASLGHLRGGTSRILGSICMESDILAVHVSFPACPSVGDQLVFDCAGAYNASMAFTFGVGRLRDP